MNSVLSRLNRCFRNYNLHVQGPRRDALRTAKVFDSRASFFGTYICQQTLYRPRLKCARYVGINNLL